ncbi:sensor histidine kinase [Dermacoccaceae bacterium W4C1]
MSAESARHWWRPRSWTLLTKLLASILTLYLVVTLVTGTATVLASRSSQLDQVDASLSSAAQAIRGNNDSNDSSSDSRPRRGGAPPPGVGLGQLTCTTRSDGQILDYTQTSQSTCYVAGTNGARTELTQSQVTALRAQATAEPKTVSVDGDDYRVVKAQNTGYVDGSLQTVTELRGLPISSVQESVNRLIRTVLLVSLLGSILIAGAAWWLVRRNLAPLRRVAATAQRVSHQPLAAGEARTQERVDLYDTDAGTEVGQVGTALNDLLDHVDRSLDARHRSEMQVRQFVADASHELRTPLASIRGYAELSRRETDPVPEGIVHALGRIESESSRMTTLVEDLLLLARLDSGRPLGRAPVDLTMLALETASDARAAGPEHVWELDLPEEPAEVIGDEARLRQVLINLLSNARKHTPAGTRITSAVRSTPDGGADLVVSDDGPGIPEDLQARVFERFTRGDAARNRNEGSTGLGLSIVHAVVSSHGGTVRVASRPGRTVFTVHLPPQPPQPTDEPSSEPDSTALDAQAAGPMAGDGASTAAIPTQQEQR